MLEYLLKEKGLDISAYGQKEKMHIYKQKKRISLLRKCTL